MDLWMQIVSQAIGLVAMAFNILSYQGRKQSTIIALQLIGGLLFAVNYIMLGALVGGILNIVTVVRAIVFLFEKHTKADRLPWLFFFISVYIAVYILNFTVFGKEPSAEQLIIEFLPVIGATALNIAFRMKSAAGTRKLALVSSPCWLIYNITAGAAGAIICEVFTLISIFVGMFRHDRSEANGGQEDGSVVT